MARLFPVFVVLTIILGVYWTIMSGFISERAVNLEVKDAARKVMAADIADLLNRALTRTRHQHRIIESMGPIARGPDWTKLNKTEEILKGLIAKTRPAVNTEATLDRPEGLDEIKKELAALEPLSLSALSDQQRTRVAVSFWIFFGASLVAWATGVLQRASR